MKTNIGKTDRILRAIIGTIVIITGIIYSSWLVLAGGVILLTSFFSWCPIYVPFGWSTKKK
jgi:hypothetical protein